MRGSSVYVCAVLQVLVLPVEGLNLNLATENAPRAPAWQRGFIWKLSKWLWTGDDGLQPYQGKDFRGWTNWGPWSKCSVTCGTGSRFRTRICLGILKSSNDICDGVEKQGTQCSRSPCKLGDNRTTTDNKTNDSKTNNDDESRHYDKEDTTTFLGDTIHMGRAGGDDGRDGVDETDEGAGDNLVLDGEGDGVGATDVVGATIDDVGVEDVLEKEADGGGDNIDFQTQIEGDDIIHEDGEADAVLADGTGYDDIDNHASDGGEINRYTIENDVENDLDVCDLDDGNIVEDNTDGSNREQGNDQFHDNEGVGQTDQLDHLNEECIGEAVEAEKVDRNNKSPIYAEELPDDNGDSNDHHHDGISVNCDKPKQNNNPNVDEGMSRPHSEFTESKYEVPDSGETINNDDNVGDNKRPDNEEDNAGLAVDNEEYTTVNAADNEEDKPRHAADNKEDNTGHNADDDEDIPGNDADQDEHNTNGDEKNNKDETNQEDSKHERKASHASVGEMFTDEDDDNGDTVDEDIDDDDKDQEGDNGSEEESKRPAEDEEDGEEDDKEDDEPTPRKKRKKKKVPTATLR